MAALSVHKTGEGYDKFIHSLSHSCAIICLNSLLAATPPASLTLLYCFAAFIVLSTSVYNSTLKTCRNVRNVDFFSFLIKLIDIIYYGCLTPLKLKSRLQFSSYPEIVRNWGAFLGLINKGPPG